MAANGKCATAVPAARLVGDPVDVVTGAVIGIDREFQLPGPFELLWRRHYDSRRHREDAGCGLGFRFEYDRRLIMDLDGLRYLAPEGSEVRVPPLDRDGQRWLGGGFRVQRISELRYQLRGGDRVTMEFAFGDPTKPAKVARMFTLEHAVSFGHDERGHLMLVADGRNRALKVSWNGRGQMSRVQLTDPAHGLQDRVVAEYEYDDAGRLTRTTDPYGHHLAYAYDKSGRLTRFTDRNGYSFHYEYDEHGRCVHTRGDGGVEELRLSYDRDARMTTAVRGNGGTWQYFYNDGDVLTQVISPSGAVTEYQYDDEGKLVREIDPNKQITTHEYDETGFNRVNGLPTGRGVAPGANLDPFDAYLRVYRVQRAPVVAHQPHAYRPSSPLEWECGNLIEPPLALPVRDSRPAFLTPDEFANLVTADRPNVGSHRDVRDAFGVLVRQERDDGPARQYHYDPNGNPSRVTDFDGGRTRYQQASWNQLVARSNPIDAQASYEYDSDENLTALVDENGNRSSFRYDLERRVDEIQRLGKVRERFVHDPAGNVSERLGPDGVPQLLFTYGDGNLLASRALASGDKQEFEYANRAALAACKSASGVLAFNPTIDGGYRTSDLRDGRGVTHDLSWGELDTSAVLERFTLKYYRFDDGSTQMVVAPGSRVHRIRLCGSGIVRKELADGTRETVQYSPQGRVLARLRASADGNSHDTRYQYSGEGDLLQVLDSEHGLTRYEYDAAHRLVHVHRPGDAMPDEYAYDAGGNLRQKPDLTYFGAAASNPVSDEAGMEQGIWLQPGNLLYRVDGDHFAYDARNHLSERRTATGTTRYRYDELDRLMAIDLPDGTPWRAEYDALGRRTKKTAGKDTWVYYWNGDRLAAEVLPDGKLRIYVYADRDQALVPFAFVDFDGVDARPESGRHYTLLSNHLGTVERVQDEQGVVVWQARLQPFGSAEVGIGADFHQPLRFPGHYCDVETGLHYNRYRYYSPELGRYLQSDPIDVEGGHNLYAYAQDGNPLRDVDLFGLLCQYQQKVLDKALADGVINEDGTPGKPIDSMLDHEKQLFCAARAMQLTKAAGDDHTQSHLTVCVTMIQDAEGNRSLLITASTDTGELPKRVQDATRPHPDDPDHPPEVTRQTRPILVDESKDGKVHPGAEQARKDVGNRDGKVVEVDKDGNHVQNVQKQNSRNDGTTDHHAEQRSQTAMQPGESVEAMGPSKKCCSGCQTALGPEGQSKVHPSVRRR